MDPRSKLIVVWHHFQTGPPDLLASADIGLELHPGEARVVKDVAGDHIAHLVTGRMPERTVAERALDRLCDDGDPERTAQRIAEFQREFTLGALQRLQDAVEGETALRLGH